MLHKTKQYFDENCDEHTNTNSQTLFTALRAVYAWDMKFNEKYVGPIRHTKQGEGLRLCVMVYRGVAADEKKIGLSWTQHQAQFSLNPALSPLALIWALEMTTTKYFRHLHTTVGLHSALGFIAPQYRVGPKK